MCNLDSILPLVRKPGRYIGDEIGRRGERQFAPADTSVAIAFPDVYEVGMSSLGVRILYHLFRKEGMRVERVFSPWVDMEEKMRKNKIPLFSLESHTPIKDFDLVAFSLQYELNYTNVLCMLDLAGIPLLSEERKEKDPIIVAGGTCVFNPLPILPFFDVFLVGEGEVLVPEMIPVIGDKSLSRNEKIAELSKLSGGLSVKNTGNLQGSVRKVFTAILSPDTIPDPPIVPFIDIVHDRLVVEIARGCTRGCRFCQAGTIYRPYRERDRKTVAEAVRCGLSKTGYGGVTLLSLSLLDHSEIEEIIRDLRGKNISLSLPSLRGDALTDRVARLIGGGSVTLAPEAGTERLRRVINKDINEDEMIASTRRLKLYGFTHAKLYFMIGLPGETDEDIEGIVKLVNTIRKNTSVKVSISPFVPRPHTPFQWERQNDIEELREKINFLKSGIKKVRVSYRDPEGCLLEGVFSRGDERLSKVVERAYGLGARFDEWSELFCFDRWMEAFEKEGIDPAGYLRERSVEKTLPWEIVDTGVRREWLLEERELSRRGDMRRDCRIIGCTGCGIFDCEIKPLKEKSVIQMDYGRRAKMVHLTPVKMRYRIMYSKTGDLRFIGHLDTTRALIRALKRAGLPLVYSQGYKPKPRVAFSPPLTLGFTSRVEYMDVILERLVPDIEVRVKRTLPDGFAINAVEILPPKGASLSSTLLHQRLRVDIPQCGRDPGAPRRDGLIRLINDFMEKEVVEIDGVNVRPAVLELKKRGDGVEILMKLGKAKPIQLFQALFNIIDEEARVLKVERIGWQ